VQLSLDTQRPGAWHYALARELAGLRDEGVLLLGSGNIVHNLRRLDWGRPTGFDWAEQFNGEVKRRIVEGDHRELAEWHMLSAESPAAIPTPEHYLPLLYVLACQEAGETLEFFNDRTVMGSISMTSLLLGGS
jgi:4,5-DOPA dioxygenase extradiol